MLVTPKIDLSVTHCQQSMTMKHRAKTDVNAGLDPASSARDMHAAGDTVGEIALRRLRYVTTEQLGQQGLELPLLRGVETSQ
jgi:hypothetical protein